MPVRVPVSLPAVESLRNENIFVIDDQRASSQDIRPLKIAVLNLMPLKIMTETDLLRLLSNTPLQIELDLIEPDGHVCKNTPREHIEAFYKKFADIKQNNCDGFIVTGAPVEKVNFEDVDYWQELTEIMEWAKKNVWSTLHICWGAQAGLYYHYGIKKYKTSKKVFGIFPHKSLDETHPLMRGLDDIYYVPHSRHTEIKTQAIAQVKDLQILSYSDMAGIHIVSDMECRKFFITGHSEYDRETLAKEYFRDKEKGLDIEIPYNYFPNDDTNATPRMEWKGTANIIFNNWLNYSVYQKTPYDLSTL